MKYRPILLVGPMGAGKSTIAAALEAMGTHRRYRLADPILQVVESVWPWVEGKAERRVYMQRVGQFLREFQPNPMIEHATFTLEASSVPLVIEDGRTAEEANWAEELGFLVVSLGAPFEERKHRLIARDGLLPDKRTFSDATEGDLSDLPLWRIDTTQQSAEVTARWILRESQCIE